MKRITEDKAREISRAKDLSVYTREQCVACDRWIEDFAMRKLRLRLRKLPNPIKNYVQLMARCHFGSLETDDFLTELECYPDWLGAKS